MPTNKATGGDSRTTKPGSRRRKRACIVCDEVKARHTSHWDLDALTHAELAAIFNDDRPPELPSWRAYLRAFGWTFFLVGTLALAYSLFVMPKSNALA